ncbi:MAG TPA: LamG domain-containing protein [Polyangia bacterium]|nr:LamG domain-containing protein [Polyangia bacterium]
MFLILTAVAVFSAACSPNSVDTIIIIEESDSGSGGPPPTRGFGDASNDATIDPDAAPSDAGASGADDGGDNPGSPDAMAATDAPVVNPPRPEVEPGVQLSRGLIFYLPLDEGPAADLHDTSVNQNRVRLVASDPAGVWVGGWRGMALRFSGTGGPQVDVESSLSLDTISDGFTIAFWYRRDNNRSEGTFVTRSAPMDRGCLYCADLIGDRLRLQINSPIVYKADLRTDQPVPVGRWIHLAFTYDQVTSATQIFVDGLPAARGVYAHPIGPQIRPVIVGDGLTGTMDEVTLHSRALSAAEIHALALGADPLR